MTSTTATAKTLTHDSLAVGHRRAGVAAEGHRDHARHDGVGREDQPGDDPGGVPVAEAPDDVLEEPARRRVAGAELGERVALQAGDRAGDQERDPDRRAGHLAGRAEQGEDPGADHRADADERGLANVQRGRRRRSSAAAFVTAHRLPSTGLDADGTDRTGDRAPPRVGWYDEQARRGRSRSARPSERAEPGVGGVVGGRADQHAEGDRHHRDQRVDDRLRPQLVVDAEQLGHADEPGRARHEEPEPGEEGDELRRPVPQRSPPRAPTASSPGRRRTRSAARRTRRHRPPGRRTRRA